MKYVRRKFKPHVSRVISRMPHTLQIFGTDRYLFVDAPVDKPKHDIVEWCNENLGEFLREWAIDTSHQDRIVFYFTSKDYAMAFKLRWA